MPKLETLLPHRKPMLLLDEIVELGENEIIAQKTIAENDFFLQGHYPDFPIVPGVITCEAMLQAGAALIAHRRAGLPASKGVPVVARIANAKFRAAIRPGDRVSILVKLVDEIGGVYFLKGEARLGDKLAASAEFSCALAPREQMGRP